LQDGVGTCADIEFIEDTAFRERSFGELEGQTKREVAKRNPKLYRKVFNDLKFVPPGGGESQVEFLERILTRIHELAHGTGEDDSYSEYSEDDEDPGVAGVHKHHKKNQNADSRDSPRVLVLTHPGVVQVCIVHLNMNFDSFSTTLEFCGNVSVTCVRSFPVFLSRPPPCFPMQALKKHYQSLSEKARRCFCLSEMHVTLKG
jgi:broad specificity phosphatase PhoE